MKSLLNIGCGTRFHRDWTNIDFVSNDPAVIACNVLAGIPISDESVDLVYNSHVLEHFSRNDARRFLLDCRRVLKPRGIIRIVVPDLEDIARAYLETMESALSGESGSAEDYEYLMLELYDQAIREHPGGDLREYLERKNISNLEFVLDRGGIEAEDMIRGSSGPGVTRRNGLARRAYGFICRNRFGIEPLIKLILGKEYSLLELGRFRRHGEPHLWMYDRYSLSKLLQEIGFDHVRFPGPVESYFENWSSFNLDTESDGRIYKPHSIYVEAMK